MHSVGRSPLGQAFAVIVTFLCPSAPHPIGGVTALYQFANGLARRGHDVHLVHAPFFRNRITSLDDLEWFRFEATIEHHLIERGGPMPPADICFGPTGDPIHGLPVVLIQGFEMLHLGIEREAFRTRALKVCIASWLVDVGQRFGAPPEQFEVVHMGIDHDRYRLLVASEDRDPVVGMLYSRHEAKGSDIGLAALARVRERRGDLEVLAFGTSEPDEPLPSWVHLTIHPDQEALVREIYNRAAVFVQPSNYEGFGFTAVEAMACGAALVTTDNGGSRDYAHPGETALTSPPGDVEALAANIERLLDDAPLRLRLAKAGRAMATTFTWDQAAADLEACLERYLADPEAYQHDPLPEPEGAWDGVDWWALSPANAQPGAEDPGAASRAARSASK
jgi:glycosyltransferase involved in cell wall biosynthesis